MSNIVTTLEIPACGIYHGVPDPKYRALSYPSRSGLEKMRQSPSHFRWAADHKSEPGRELVLGAAFHVMILQPELWAASVVVTPEDAPEKRSKADKEWWAKFADDHAGKHIITQDEFMQLQGMKTGLMNDETAWKLLAGGGHGYKTSEECTVIWLHPNGVICKCRIDRVIEVMGDVMIVDLKTTRNASEDSFGRDAVTYGYFREMAFYRQALGEAMQIPEEKIKTFLVTIEKEPPYEAAVYQPGPLGLEAGRKQMSVLVERYAECIESGKWPGYGGGIRALEMPAWARKESCDE